MSQTTKKRRSNRRARRANRRQARVQHVLDRLSVEQGKCSQTGNPYVVGRVDGKVAYTSRVVRSQDHYSRLRNGWLRRTSLRLAVSKSK